MIDNENYAEAKGYKQIRNYKLFDPPIGKGTTGIVYKAWDSKYNRLVAIKSIPSKYLSNEQKQKAFQNEVRALHQLKHKNIIKILSVEKTVNNTYLSLEYANYGTLEDLLQKYKSKYGTGIHEWLVQKLIIQLIDGLEYMHDKKHMHRDLKLENVLLNLPEEYLKVSFENLENSSFEGLELKIADLGYARELEANDLAGTLCGTPLFMPVEMVLNFKNINKKGYKKSADIWSLGAITYNLIIGQPPFMGYNQTELFENIATGKYSYPKSCMLSIEAISFINGLISFNEEDRFTFKQMRQHPFIANHFTTFHPIDLNIIPSNTLKNNSFEVDCKDKDNFLWVMYKHDELKNLDKLNTKDLNDKKIMESVLIINNNLNSPKRNMLSRFRKGNTSKMKNTICNDPDTDPVKNNNKDQENEQVKDEEKEDILDNKENKIEIENVENKDEIQKIFLSPKRRINENKEKDKDEKNFSNEDIQENEILKKDDQIIDRNQNIVQNENDNQVQNQIIPNDDLDNLKHFEIIEKSDFDIVSCYSLLERDNDLPNKGDVDVLTYSNFTIDNNHFLSQV